jgi:Flp pilus assembly CpaE family ATPase
MEEKARKVLVVEDNPADSRLVQEMLSNVEGQTFEVQCAESLVAALDALTHDEFDIALVDLSLPDSEGLATFETIQRHASALPIVVFTGVTNEMLALTAVARGAQDYLVKGRMTSQALARVLRYAMARQQNANQHGLPEKARAQVIGFLGAKGGVGSTTLAAHFAVAWQRQTEDKVLLLDVDTSSTSTEFLMKTKSKYSMLDAATNLHRLDLTFWNSVITESPFGIDVLPSPGAVSFAEQLSIERVRHVVRFARPLYQCIVVDLARLNTLSLNLLEEIGTLYVVTTAELPSVSEVSRVLKKLLELRLTPDQVRLVFNRVPKAALNPVPEFEKALGYPAYAGIGDFTAELTEAYGCGRSLDENLNLHKQIAKMIHKSLGRETQQAQTAVQGLRRFFRKALA